MNAWSKFTSLATACALSALFGAGSATAAEISVLSGAGPMPEVLGTLAPMFERASGHKVKLTFKAVPAIVKDVKEGAGVDLMFADPGVIDDLIKDGAIAAGGNTRIMLSRVGVAVRQGAAKPNIATADGLKAALVAAKTVGYSQGTSGQHFLTVVQRLGLTDVIKSKAVVVQGRPVGAAVASGEAEIGVQQVAELLPVAGIDLIGPLPGDLQKIIVYAAGVPAKAKEAEAAKALVRFLASEAAVSKLKQMGMDPAI
jgi:molybdate transport system substrate-binding protein